MPRRGYREVLGCGGIECGLARDWARVCEQAMSVGMVRRGRTVDSRQLAMRWYGWGREDGEDLGTAVRDGGVGKWQMFSSFQNAGQQVG